MDLARFTLISALPFLGLSIFYTLRFSTDPLFQAPDLPAGPTHTNYHAFRGGMLSIGVVVALVYMTFLISPQDMHSYSWNLTAIVTAFYFVGWWLPGPLLRLGTPDRKALINHILATALTLLSLLLSKPYFYS